jgi:hypothetical protein
MKTLVLTLCLTIVCAGTYAAEPGGIMVGAPPPAAQQVTLENWLTPQFNAWSFQHVESIMPTTTVDRGTGAVSALDAQPYDLGTFEFADPTGKKRNVAQFLSDQHIDGIDFTEIYDDPNSSIYQFSYAAGFRPVPAGVRA